MHDFDETAERYLMVYIIYIYTTRARLFNYIYIIFILFPEPKNDVISRGFETNLGLFGGKLGTFWWYFCINLGLFGVKQVF